MSLSEEQQLLLSQLVDGELPVDEANEVLAGVLAELGEAVANCEAAGRLDAMLRMRQALAPWRRLAPPRPVVAVPAGPPRRSFRQAAWRWAGLAAAAMLGGVLVAGGMYLRGRRTVIAPEESVARPPAVIVTPEQRREIAHAFALHESVAGPLSWYAADDTTIQVAPAERGEALHPPIAVALQLAEGNAGFRAGAATTYLIVCRGTDPASVELPASAMAGSVRLRLLPTAANGEVNLHYAIAAEQAGPGPSGAALVGRRHVGLDPTVLGQLALNDRLVSVGASAWVMHEPLIP